MSIRFGIRSNSAWLCLVATCVLMVNVQGCTPLLQQGTASSDPAVALITFVGDFLRSLLAAFLF